MGDRTEARTAGDVVRNNTPRGPVQGNCGATFPLLGKISLGSIIFRRLCVVRLFGEKPEIGSLIEAANEVQAG